MTQPPVGTPLSNEPRDITIRAIFDQQTFLALPVLGIWVGLVVVRLLTDVNGLLLLAAGAAAGVLFIAPLGWRLWNLARQPLHPEDTPRVLGPIEQHVLRRTTRRLFIAAAFTFPFMLGGLVALFTADSTLVRVGGLVLALVAVIADTLAVVYWVRPGKPNTEWQEEAL